MEAGYKGILVAPAEDSTLASSTDSHVAGLKSRDSFTYRLLVGNKGRYALHNRFIYIYTHIHY